MTLDVGAWPGLALVEQLVGGHRNEVWRGQYGDDVVAVRQSRRSEASLSWELDLLEFLASHGVLVAEVVPTIAGARHDGEVVVQRWLDGREPVSDVDWHAVAEVLQTIHTLTPEYPQRPGCCAVTELALNRRSVDADLDLLPADIAAEILGVFESFVDVSQSVIHGDPWQPNIRITPGGQVGLLDFDESRVDCVWHDLSNLGVQVLDDDDHHRANQLSHAWEAVNAWIVEPDYALERLTELRLERRIGP